MPIPKPEKNEDSKKFVSRCMTNEVMKKEYPDSKQRVAICLGQTRQKSKNNLLSNVLEILGFSLSYNDCDECGDVVDVSLSEIFPPPIDTDFGGENRRVTRWYQVSMNI